MTGLDGKTASEVSQWLLDITATAMLNNDFDTLSRYFHLPHVIETPDRKTILKTISALRAVFDSVVEDYANRQITDLIRICEVAEYRGPFRIEATHTTHMMSGSQRVVDPFPSFSVLEFIDDRWQIVSSQYAVDKQTAVGRALSMTTASTDTKPQATAAGGQMNRKN